MIDLAGIMGLHSMINQEQYHHAVADKFDNEVKDLFISLPIAFNVHPIHKFYQMIFRYLYGQFHPFYFFLSESQKIYIFMKTNLFFV